MSEGTREKDLLERINVLQNERDTFAQALSKSTMVFNKRVKELSVIKRIGESMRWNHERSKVCKGLVDIIIDELPAENCSLWLVNNEIGSIELRVARGRKDSKTKYFAPNEPAFSRLALGEGVVGWVADNGKSLNVTDVTKSKYSAKLEEKMDCQIRSILCAPISRGRKVTGAINLSHPDVGAFSDEDERLLDTIAEQAALAFSNLILHERLSDLTEHLELLVTQRSKELKFSETKYSSFMGNAGSAIIIANQQDGKIVEANNEASKLMKIGRDKIVGTPFYELVEDHCFEQVMDSSNTGRGRFNGLALKGGLRDGVFVDINANAISTDEGSYIYLIVHDVTYQTNLEIKLKNYSDHLEEIIDKRTQELQDAHQELLLATKLAAIGELASSVAHEINNPLTVINGYVEDMVELFGSGDNKPDIDSNDILERLSVISAQADRCKDITWSLLNFARQRDINIELLDIGEVILQAIHFVSHRERKVDIKFDYDIRPEIPHISSDMSMIEQVLVNIYSNAIDAIDSTEENGNISTSVFNSNDGINITIKDTGPGMTAAEMEYIFDPFYTTKPAFKGTGLGLSICKKLIERLGGTITAQSVLGEGSQFMIFLPIKIN